MANVIRKFINIVNENSVKLYHRAPRDRSESILQNGLKINSDINVGMESGSSYDSLYGCHPIFLSIGGVVPVPHGVTIETIELEINASGLRLAVDFPALNWLLMDEDWGYFEINNGILEIEGYNDEDDIPEELCQPFKIADLLKFGTNAYNIVTKQTSSCACLNNIPPTSLRLIGEL